MPTPSERLASIIASYTPSEVKFRPGKLKTGGVTLECFVTKALTRAHIETDARLQAALHEEINETWNQETGQFNIDVSTEALWNTIKRRILREYEDMSDRCTATKRKTEKFIREIDINDKYLPTFLLQVFMTIKATDYESKSELERRALLEQFEPLRRTYGKRH